MENLEEKIEEIGKKLDKHINEDFHGLLEKVTNIENKVTHTNRYVIGGMGLMTAIIYLIVAIVN